MTRGPGQPGAEAGVGAVARAGAGAGAGARARQVVGGSFSSVDLCLQTDGSGIDFSGEVMQTL